MYRTRKVRIYENDSLYEYCDRITRQATNLSNAVRFRQRQVLTAVKKHPSEWTDNESAIMNEIRQFLPVMNQTGNKSYSMPQDKKSFLSYQFLDNLLKCSGNPDYFADGFPRQSAQQIIKRCVRDMKSFFAAFKEYQKDPSSFQAVPSLPGYQRKGGHTTAIITNQDAKFRTGYIKLPLTEEHLLAGEIPAGYFLKEVQIIPEGNSFLFSIIMENKENPPAIKEQRERIAAVDLGVNNLMAVTNNCGLPCLLYKGGYVKSVNRLYNKKIAALMSVQTLATGKKYVPDEAFSRVTIKRNDTISDLMHKTAKHFVSWCVENRIDTVVLGENVLWKQNSNMDHINNQTFIQIPFASLRGMIRYLCEEKGILCICQEESYTSKASFPDRDPIPVYQKEDVKKAVFSGKRGPNHHKGHYNSNGFRGIYETSDGTHINSDLNGSANILRKAYPEAFTDKLDPDFNRCIVVKHPDYQKIVKRSPDKISHSKKKRLIRKSIPCWDRAL